jgi:hypothetical protein
MVMAGVSLAVDRSSGGALVETSLTPCSVAAATFCHAVGVARTWHTQDATARVTIRSTNDGNPLGGRVDCSRGRVDRSLR